MKKPLTRASYDLKILDVIKTKRNCEWIQFYHSIMIKFTALLYETVVYTTHKILIFNVFAQKIED